LKGPAIDALRQRLIVPGHNTYATASALEGSRPPQPCTPTSAPARGGRTREAPARDARGDRQGGGAELGRAAAARHGAEGIAARLREACPERSTSTSAAVPPSPWPTLPMAKAPSSLGEIMGFSVDFVSLVPCVPA
jgi:hypothetical protein